MLSWIQVLDLSRNNLSEAIPLHGFKNFTRLIKKNSELRNSEMGAGLNPLLLTYHILAKTVVRLKGQEYEYSATLYLLKLNDLSSNRIEGDIPKDVFQMKGIVSLNLSRNHLRGHIDPAVHEMESLESLYLSRNQLSGLIPIGLGDLRFLDFLDLSNNNFSGKIPSSTQLQSFDASTMQQTSGYAAPLCQCAPRMSLLILHPVLIVTMAMKRMMPSPSNLF